MKSLEQLVKLYKQTKVNNQRVLETINALRHSITNNKGTNIDFKYFEIIFEVVFKDI